MDFSVKKEPEKEKTEGSVAHGLAASRNASLNARLSGSSGMPVDVVPGPIINGRQSFAVKVNEAGHR